VYNKIDTITIEEIDKLARQPNSVVVSEERVVSLVFQKKYSSREKNENEMCVH
jgi:hypothetical protein